MAFVPSVRFAFPALLVAALAFALYVPSLGSGFVYDAEAQVLIDGYIHDPSHIAEVATLRVLGKDVLDASRPAHLLSLMFDSLLWGRNPAGYHFTSILLHAVNTGMLCLLLLLLLPHGAGTMRRSVAALCALIFAVHPVNVEAVAEVSYREDLLATGFLLVSLLAAAGFVCSRGWRAGAWAAGAVFAVLLACASKETGVAGPFLLAAYGLLFCWRRWDPSPRGGGEPGAHAPCPGREFVFLVAAAALVTAGFYLARFNLQAQDSLIFSQRPPRIGGSVAEFLAIQTRLWVHLIKNIVWPIGLSADYTPQNIAWIPLAAACAVLAVVVAGQLWLAGKSRLAAFGALIFWLGLAPVSNIMPLFRPLADRFLYLPMTGVAFMLAGALMLVAPQKNRWRLVMAVLAFALVPLAVLNVRRQAVFASSVALWRDTARVSPFSNTAANNLGYALLDTGDFEAALVSFQRAWDLTGGKKADAAAGAAIVLEKLGETADAGRALHEAIKLDARYADPGRLVRALVMRPDHAEVLERVGRHTR